MKYLTLLLLIPFFANSQVVLSDSTFIPIGIGYEERDTILVSEEVLCKVQVPHCLGDCNYLQIQNRTKRIVRGSIWVDASNQTDLVHRQEKVWVTISTEWQEDVSGCYALEPLKNN